MKPRLICLWFILLAWVSGCAVPPKTPVPAVPEAPPGSNLQIDNRIIQKSIDDLEIFLKTPGLSQDQQETAQAVLHAYRLLQQLASQPFTENDSQQLVQALFKAATLMDERLFKKKTSTSERAEIMAAYAKKREDLINCYLKQDGKGVIRNALEIEEIFGPDALTPDIGLLVAIALGKSGDLEQAIQIGETLSGELDRLPDVMELRSKIALWQIASGRKAAARQTYERLTDDEDERIALVQKVGQQIQAAETEPSARQPVSAEAALDSRAPFPESGYTMEQLLKAVDSLVRKHDYRQARLLLLKARIRVGEGSDQERLDKELEAVEDQEAAFQEEKRIRDAYMKQTHDTAKRLIEEEQYEAAIQTLNDGAAAEEQSEASRALRERAVERLINKERNRAAELFLAAKKTDDPTQKKALLDSAYQILKTLVDTYPTSPLCEKLKSHMAIVQGEMDRL